MPKHAFKFPSHIRMAVKSYVYNAYSKIDASRYEQESPYTTALATRLEGVVYDKSDGFIEFHSTIVNDRGKNSAESKYGADLAITAFIQDSKLEISKAILIQVKRDKLDNQRDNAITRELCEQVTKMKQLTSSPKIMELQQESKSLRIPYMISGNKFLNGETFKRQRLDTYFTARVLTTFDGSTDPDFLATVKHSNLPTIYVNAKLTH